MTTQPEALRLANHLDLFRSFPDDLAAAAELRRLHQSEREGWRYADELEQERKRLYALNQELLEAVKSMCAEFRGYDLPYGSKAYQQGIAAIAKHGGQA